MQLRQIRLTPADQALARHPQVEQCVMAVTNKQMPTMTMAVTLVTVIRRRIIVGVSIERLHNLHTITSHLCRMGMKCGGHIHQQQGYNNQYGG